MIKRSLPTPAMVVACLALFVAMGGTGYAATQLSSGKDQATASKKKAKRGPRGKQGPAGAKGANGANGANGASGAPGAPGAAGSAVAYAHIEADGSVDLVNSKNVTTANVRRAEAGVYCFKDLPFTVHVVLATPDSFGPSDGILVNPTFPGGGLAGCEGSEARVRVTTAAAPTTASDHPFYLLFE
jgi:Collagen triple helix repeat (20 copies)